MFVTFLSSLALTAAAQDVAEDAPTLQLEAPAEPVSALVDTAEGYAAYHSVIADLRDAPIGSANDLDSAMDRLTTFYSDERLVRAWIAYTAMIAARHPEYLDDVRELADYYGPQAAMSGLMYDPAYATSFTHSADAQASVVDALERDTAQIREVSERYRAAAYDLQTGNDGRWARVRARDRQDRLDSITNAGEREIALDADISSLVTSGMAASELFQPASAEFETEAMTPQLSLTVGETSANPDRTRIGRILSVAALEDLSTDPQRSSEVIDALLSDPVVERCLAWVRLDLQQCVAAGHYKYEDSFCIAEHALLDVSRCLGASTGASN